MKRHNQLPANSKERLDALNAECAACSTDALRIMLQGARGLATSRGRDFPYYRTKALHIAKLYQDRQP